MQNRVLAVLVAAILVAAPSAAFGQADGKKYEGRAVADVLRELQATRLKIIFSTELVPPLCGSSRNRGGRTRATSRCRSSSRTV